MIRDHIAAHLGIEPADFEYAPFAEEGRLGKVYQLFGNELNALIEQLNESLSLMKKDGDALFDHYRHTLEKLGKQKGPLGLIFPKSQNTFLEQFREILADVR